MVLTIYKSDASSPSRTVLMTIKALEISNVEYVDISVLNGDQFSEEYLKLNPQHTIPLLKDDDFIVWDSHAISAYLVSVYGKDDSLYPNNPKQKALVDQRLHFDSGILFPVLRNSVTKIFFHGDKSFPLESLGKIQSAYEHADNFLMSSWMIGDVLTLADISCVSSISTLNEILPIDKTKYTNLWNWLQRCSQLDFYKTMNVPGLIEFKNLLKSKLQ